MPANTVTTYTTVGNREDLIDKVFMISPSDTPFTSAIDKVDADGVLHEWQTDALRAPNGSNAAVEGADATYAAQTPTTRLGNRCQIVQDTFSVSGTQEAVKKAGPKEIARLSAKKMVELKKDIEAAAITNATAVVGSTSVARTMRGLKGWIATNFYGGAGSAAPVPSTNTAPVAGTNRAWAETILKSMLLGAYMQGGNVSQVHIRPADKQVSSTFAGNATRQVEVTGTGKQAVLNTAYAVYAGDFGNVSMIPNRVMSGIATPDNAAYAVDTDLWALATLRPFDKEELAKTGDARNFQITWEGTLEARNEASSAQGRDLS
ncbi:Major head protein [Paraburkholderia tropica]